MTFIRAANSEDSTNGNRILESKRLPSPMCCGKWRPCFPSPIEGLGLPPCVQQAVGRRHYTLQRLTGKPAFCSPVSTSTNAWKSATEGWIWFRKSPLGKFCGTNRYLQLSADFRTALFPEGEQLKTPQNLEKPLSNMPVLISSLVIEPIQDIS